MSIFMYEDLALYYEVKGNASAEKTIAFFNGVMASTSSWDALWPIFEAFGYRIVLHDFKGQLKSGKPTGPYSFEDHCEEAHALFDHLGIQKVHIVGTSYGGEIAMKFAIMYPDMTESIAIIDSVSEIDSVMKAFVDSWSMLCDLKDGEKFFWGMLPSIYGPSFVRDNMAMLKARAKALNAVPQEYFTGQKILYDTFLKDADFTDELSQIECPALIICGEDDLLKRPSFSRILAGKIKGAEFALLPDCGHVAIFEKPDILRSLLAGFILKQGL
ncbi:MAG: hypothetical protein PWQ12_1618 [Clostridiales bacterium]|jgi:3-oxoadipate enol-lactonase|nr:hypothetical protein [Clostridiales bacterium]